MGVAARAPCHAAPATLFACPPSHLSPSLVSVPARAVWLLLGLCASPPFGAGWVYSFPYTEFLAAVVLWTSYTELLAAVVLWAASSCGSRNASPPTCVVRAEVRAPFLLLAA